jgi:sterol desaturase/sphingolipid hydroxylase (fatty acid hydroxylase superfamily)
VFEIALNVCSMFTHANVRLPALVERALRLAIVTRRAHRLHHDRAMGRMSCNYGFSTNLWDKLFGTWRTGPEPERLGITDGPDDPARLGATLLAPLAVPGQAPSR